VTPKRVGRALPDAPRGNWVDRHAPADWRPYLRMARIDRPIGWWLLLLPCWWSAAVAAIAGGRPLPDPFHCLLFLIGAIAMRGAGSTYNDIVDRNLDAKVARTRDRPLPSGAVTVAGALALTGALCLVGLLVLLQLNGFAVLVGFGSLGWVALYPFMKRLIWMPQIVLGLAFAWGGLMGWAAAFGRLDPPALVLYLAAVAWTVGYDTIYALQDVEDDEVVGIKSSARLFGPHVRGAVAASFAITVVLIAVCLAMVQAGAIAYAALAAFAAHLAWQVRRIDPHDGAVALRLFRSNRDAGLILFAGLTVAAFVRASV
jgi:4-hydroxybenzoate polyprenyltransferase